MKRRASCGLLILGILLNNVYARTPPGPSKESGKTPELVAIEARVLDRADDSLLQAEFTLKMEKNIHIFSSESHFFALQAVESTGVGPLSLKLPAPKRYRGVDGNQANIYTGTVKIMLTCRITAVPWELHGYIQYQACDKTRCFFPAKKWFTFSSNGAAGSVERLSDSPPEQAQDPDIRN